MAGLRFFNLAETPKRITLRIAAAEPIAAFRNRPTETPETGKEAEEFTLTTNTGTHVLTVQDEEGNQLARRTGVALDPGDYLTIFLTGDETESAPYYIGIVRHRWDTCFLIHNPMVFPILGLFYFQGLTKNEL